MSNKKEKEFNELIEQLKHGDISLEEYDKKKRKLGFE